MNKTARLIITLDCNRNCHYCCNTEKMLASATKITDLSELNEYSEICITGGEPMLNPIRTSEIIEKLNHLGEHYWRKHNKFRKIYLYTALATSLGNLALVFNSGLDGIHYTLHSDSTIIDTVGISNLEKISKQHPYKSFILHIHPEFGELIVIKPDLWSKIENKPFIKDCPLPENEDLFKLA